MSWTIRARRAEVLLTVLGVVLVLLSALAVIGFFTAITGTSSPGWEGAAAWSGLVLLGTLAFAMFAAGWHLLGVHVRPSVRRWMRQRRGTGA